MTKKTGLQLIGLRSACKSKQVSSQSAHLKVTPFNIYKYTEYRWAKRLIEYGEIRVSPINEFHDTIKHGEAIGDVNEGKFTKTIEKFTAEDYKAAIKQGEAKVRNKIAPIFSGLEGKGQIRHARISMSTGNAIVFCASIVLSKEIMTKLCGSYDSCVFIFDPQSFHLALTEEIDKQFGVIRSTYLPCFYDRIAIDINSHDYYFREALHCFFKPRIHAWQKEVRFIWHLQDCPQKPINISIPNISKLCRVIRKHEIL